MNDRIIAGAQIGLSVLYTVGYFAIVIMFMLGYADVPDKFENMFTGLINLLSAAQLAVIYFWFQRTRAKADETQGGLPNA